MRIIVSLIILALVNTAALFGQDTQTTQVKDITGRAIGGINNSPAELINMAVKNAKIEALSAAGIHEQINTYQNLYKSETDEEYAEVFQSDIFTNISGVVKSVQITDTIAQFNPETFTLMVEVKIKAEVVKYNKKQDRTFDAWVDGIRPFYNNGQNLSFTIKPTKPCYLRAFLIARDQESYAIFPNSVEKDIELKPMETNTFPLDAYYEMTTQQKKEPHRIIIVLVKEKIPYTNEVAYKPILNWIFSISPQKRVVKNYGFTVVKNSETRD